MIVLYENALKREEERFKLQAALHGAKFDEDEDIDTTDTPKRKTTKAKSFMFGDPKDYEHLSPEERQRLTEQMMGKHQLWRKQTILS